MALGAGSESVVRLFVRDVAVVVVGGAIVGLAISLPAGRFIGEQFTGGPGSPWLIATVAAGLVVTALVATLGPALRAARTDPTTTLRQE
jgi:ABC-type antimicrobial peptide transport system permease subunit